MDEQIDPIEHDEFVTYEEILEDYRRRQMIEHLTGPMISLMLHAAVVIACALLLVGKEIKETPQLEFSTREMELKPLDPKVIEQLDDLQEEVIDDLVPKVEKPNIKPEEVSVSDTKDFSEAMAASEMDMDLSMLLEVQNTTTPLTLKGLYSNRSEENRKKALKRFAGGMGDATERAVLRALLWLRDHQNADGSWSTQYDEAMTGLALLAFLAHGETPDSGQFGLTVQKAIQWLSNYMLSKPADTFTASGYAHGIATYALCEAYALTKLPIVKPAMEKGLNRMIQGQQETGGWDYGYAKGERWDLSVSAWQIQALKAGYAAGAQVQGHEEAIALAVDWLKQVNYKGGTFGYAAPGGGSAGMQGAGSLALQLLGEGKSSQAMAAVKNISDNMQPNWPEEGGGGHANGSYAWYYQTQAMFHAGKSYFREWNKKFAPMLIKHQKADGHWDSPGEGEVAPYDAYYATTLNALSLQVYYRYLPSYQDPDKIAKAAGLFDLEEGLDLDLE